MALQENPKQGAFSLASNPKYLGFQKVDVTKVDETKPWEPPIEVSIIKADGQVDTNVDANTTFFTFTDKDGGKLLVSAAAAGHIDSLHIKGEDAGSKFAHASLEELFLDMEDKLPADVAKTPGVSAFDMEMGKNMGKEGIATMQELEAEGVISRADMAKADAVRQQVYILNRSGNQAAKEAFISDFADKNPDSKIQFQLVRGTVLVPVVDAPKRPTTKLFVVFGPAGKDTKTMWTAAPGRYMPKHPNPAQFEPAEIDSGAFDESAKAWFDTVMLTGVEKAEEPKVDADKLNQAVSDTREAIKGVDAQPAVKLLDLLLRSDEYREKVIALRTAKERDAISALEKEAEAAAQKRLTPLKNAVALASLGETDLAVGKKRGKEWGAALKAVQEVELEIDGSMRKVSLDEAMKHLHAEETATRAEKMTPLQNALNKAVQRETANLDELAAELEAKKNDPDFQEALAAWGNAPDAKGGRGVDDKGFHAGIIHYFEYRAYKDKAGRYNKEKNGAFSLNGFIEHSKSLARYIQPGADLKSMPDVRGFARFTDENGRERLFLMTDEWTITAFKWEGESQLGVITVLPNKSNDSKDENGKRFRKMVTQEASHTANEKNFLNHLGEQRNLVDADDKTRALIA